MSLSKAQIIYLQSARRQINLDDAGYRMVLRTAGDVETSKDLNNAGFESVMAQFEALGFRDRNKSPTHFRDKVDRAQRFGTERQIRYIHAMAAETRYPVEGMCRRHSHGRTDNVEELDRTEVREVIEAYKAITGREEDKRTPVPPPNPQQQFQRNFSLFPQGATIPDTSPQQPKRKQRRYRDEARDKASMEAQWAGVKTGEDEPF